MSNGGVATFNDLSINKSGTGYTQFGRAMGDLNIDIICANSPQAKGRVERAHKTLQDRLVKELRLAGVSTIEAANAFLPAFMADHNARFAKEPRRPEDLHRPAPGAADLDEILVVREERTVSASLTLCCSSWSRTRPHAASPASGSRS